MSIDSSLYGNPPVWLDNTAEGRIAVSRPHADMIGSATVREHWPTQDISCIVRIFLYSILNYRLAFSLEILYNNSVDINNYSCDDSINENSFVITKPQLVEGNVIPTTWQPNMEDVTTDVQEAHEAAKYAELEADKAKERMDNWVADNVFSKLEQQGLEDELRKIQADYSEISTECSKYDIEMGRRAGTRTCGVTYGNGSPQELKEAGADYLLDDFKEILSIL